jgi:hypothetical protein
MEMPKPTTSCLLTLEEAPNFWALGRRCHSYAN